MVNTRNLLGDPRYQLLRLKDQLIGVALLNDVSVNQAADPQSVDVWVKNRTSQLIDLSQTFTPRFPHQTTPTLQRCRGNEGRS